MEVKASMTRDLLSLLVNLVPLLFITKSNIRKAFHLRAVCLHHQLDQLHLLAGGNNHLTGTGSTSLAVVFF